MSCRMVIWCGGCVVHIRRGVLRCSSSTCKAIPTASNREASNSAGLHAFFMSYCIGLTAE